MNRKSFLRNLIGSIAAIAVSPVISKLAIQGGGIAMPTMINASLFNDLNFIIPEYIPSLIAKYGNEEYSKVIELLG